ncbi:helix-turn-helix transcriptional regulator [Nocardia sp. NPDC004604]|uniref:helix-turn-helix domain-containing protein n=1 Tax=Nocardia sp. NPDC004604 TaxID=3157013 RepID=UPI0033AE9CF3
MSEHGSTVARRQLGMYLRNGREECGLTLRQAADLIQRSPSTLQRIEKGTVVHLREVDLEARLMLLLGFRRKRQDSSVCDHIPFEARKRDDDLAESGFWDPDFEIMVCASGTFGEQLERPSARHVPRNRDTMFSRESP